MADPTETYVDPSIAANSGAGTVGDPYGDLQFALDTITRNSSNGDRFNIKSGTDEIMSAAIDLTTYGTPNNIAPLIFQGYATAAGDGDFAAGTGIGGISGGGSVSVFASTTLDHIGWKHLHLHNCGANIIVNGDREFHFIECEIENGTAGGVDVEQFSRVIGCHFHDIDGAAVNVSFYTLVYGNYFANGGKTMDPAIKMSGQGTDVCCNILSLDSSSNGIEITQEGNAVFGNSILSSSGTGNGVLLTATKSSAVIINNLIEGFSGSGGVGLSINSSRKLHTVRNNAMFNNTTDISTPGDIDFWDYEDNESLSATPFDKSGSDTFVNRLTYFSPVDTGNVHGGAYVGAA